MQHKAKAESVEAIVARHTKKGQLQTVPNMPTRPRTTRPDAQSANARRKVVATAAILATTRKQLLKLRGPRQVWGDLADGGVMGPQPAVGSYSIDNSNGRQNYQAGNGGSNRSKSVVGYNTCLNTWILFLRRHVHNLQ